MNYHLVDHDPQLPSSQFFQKSMEIIRDCDSHCMQVLALLLEGMSSVQLLFFIFPLSLTIE